MVQCTLAFKTPPFATFSSVSNTETRCSVSKCGNTESRMEEKALLKVEVLFFAACREITGVEKIELKVEEKTTIKTFVADVVKKYPKIGKMMDNMVLSVNLEYTDPNSEQTLKDADKVAFIPPISGG
uniref:MOCS2A n=1 Tax=Lotharella globosa TaxID=91324 RepID=A0A6V3INM5_9EUKA